jgi:hypothetical protein
MYCVIRGKKEQRHAQLETAVVDSVGQLCREPQFTNDKHFQKGKKSTTTAPLVDWASPATTPSAPRRHHHHHTAAATTTTTTLLMPQRNREKGRG